MIVPLSFIAQMVPVSVNSFGVREATFSFYLTRESDSRSNRRCSSPLVPQALIMICSLARAAVFVSRAQSARVPADASP